ncbi:MAG: hypothetical protein ACPL4N_00415, partial [Candidatus Norongarragalinales archaeon]
TWRWVTAYGNSSLSVGCSSNEVLVSGGADCSSSSIIKSAPTTGLSGWSCNCSTTTTIRCYALCCIV